MSLFIYQASDDRFIDIRGMFSSFEPTSILNLLVDAQIFCKYANNDMNGMVVGITKPSRDSGSPSEGSVKI